MIRNEGRRRLRGSVQSAERWGGLIVEIALSFFTDPRRSPSSCPDAAVPMNNVDVTYETYAEQEVIAISTEDGVRVEIAAEDQETFYELAHEVFGDPSTVAGRAYRSVLQRETTSGMTVKELIQAGRQAALNEN